MTDGERGGMVGDGVSLGAPRMGGFRDYPPRMGVGRVPLNENANETRTEIMLFMACICFCTMGLFIIPCICAICAFTFFAVSGSFIALA